MNVKEYTDKQHLLQFLKQDRYLHIYSIGDLDDFFWPRTRWFGIERDGELRSVFLLYTAPHLPVLLALEENEEDAARQLLKELIPILPDKFYCHLSPELSSVLQSICDLQSHGLHSKMKLNLQSFRSPHVQPEFRCQILTANALPTITAFYSESYPDNWFDARMLETGKYVGVFARDKLIGIAGVHVYSKEYGVAALGNVTTHPEFRGRGVGEIATGQLCKILAKDLSTIGLNVHVDNVAAIRCYEKLGFEYHAQYEEFVVTKLPI